MALSSKRINAWGLLLVGFVSLAAWNFVGVSGDVSAAIAEDEHVKELFVNMVDRDECNQDLACEDWCKDRKAARCACRCPDFVTEGDFACKDSAKYCQALPRNFWGGSYNVTSKSFSKACKKHM